MPLTNLPCDEALLCDETLPCQGGISLYAVSGVETLSLDPAVLYVHEDATFPGIGTYPGVDTYPGGRLMVIPAPEPVELTLVPA